ncbi:26S proteasome regulatory subunit Rpn5p [Diutina catenulata]
MSREDPIKPEKDLSAVVSKELPVALELPFDERVEKMLSLEKQTRQAQDVISSKKVLTALVDVLTSEPNWAYLNDLITTLTKKHGQLKSSIQAFIQEIMAKLPQLSETNKSELKTKMEIIETIRTVTDKKIFVEVERAEVSRTLAQIYLERLDNLDKAVDILCDLQVETYSMMPFTEKIEFILLQIKLTLQKGDYAQAKILSRKIMLKSLKSHDDYKATYLGYLMEINRHEYDYLALVKNALMLSELPNPDNSLFVSIVYYIILARWSPEQNDLMLRIKANSAVSKQVSKATYKLLEIFTTNELIHWSNIQRDYASDFASVAKSIFDDQKNVDNLQKRIIEHNLRIVNKYYSCIQLPRLAQLLQLSSDEAESNVSELVNDGMITAKINRPMGVVRFDASKSGGSKASDASGINEVLNEWCYDVEKLLEEVDSIGHLINKEEMMHGIKQKA